MQHIYRCVAAAICALVLAHTAIADGLPTRSRVGAPEVASTPFNWTGFYISGGAGYGLAHTEVDVWDGFINIDGLSGDGYVADVRAGFDYRITGTPFVVGVFVGHSFGDMKFSASLDDHTLSATITPEMYAGGRLGMLIGPNAMIYGGGAWQRAKGSLGGIAEGSQRDDTILYLAGLEYAFSNNLRLGVEYNYAEHAFNVGNVVDVDAEVHTIKARLLLAINPF